MPESPWGPLVDYSGITPPHPQVYKVLKVRLGVYTSALACHRALVTYELNKWAEAPPWLAKQGYFLVAFLDLRRARNFCQMLNFPHYPAKIEIWTCEAPKIIRDLPPIQAIDRVSFGHLTSRGDTSTCRNSVSGWPWGTVMCRRLRPVRKVEPWDIS